MHWNQGWRGTIGVMTGSVATQVDFHNMAPDGVAICTTLLPLEKGDAQGLIKMGEYVEEAATLLALKKPDVIVFACTAGSLVKGIAYDKEIIGRIEGTTGIAATTTTTAVTEALGFLRAKKVSIVSPYIAEVNRIEKAFMEASGFEVTSIKGLGFADGEDIHNVRPGEMYRLARETCTKDAEALFISCTALSVFNIIDALETDLGIPVVTSNQATLWMALRKINVRETIAGLGKLFKMESVA